MGKVRQHPRTNCDSCECILMELDGSTYSALLENISLGGAWIKMNGGVPKSMQVGDVCDLLCNNLDLCPSKLSCRVVRRDSGNMGVSFLTDRDQ
ncbi:MAG: PilZ domain-containing protein [Desulfuromonadaceae bacterium]|nr:PilZ domain-containing protein [Desulfuromonadaceae bacterium]